MRRTPFLLVWVKTIILQGAPSLFIFLQCIKVFPQLFYTNLHHHSKTVCSVFGKRPPVLNTSIGQIPLQTDDRHYLVQQRAHEPSPAYRAIDSANNSKNSGANASVAHTLLSSSTIQPTEPVVIW